MTEQQSQVDWNVSISLTFVATFIDVLAYQMVLLSRLFCIGVKNILAVCRGLSCPTT
jgi:hypothetical protein